MTGYIFMLLTTLSLGSFTSCRISNERLEPVSIYTLNGSKFEVKDVIDSIVYKDSFLVFQELTDYIDTYILDKTFRLVDYSQGDSVIYMYYYSGDVKQWFENTDSTILVLSHLSVNGKTYDSKTIKRLSKNKIESVLGKFRHKIVEMANSRIHNYDEYDIRIIDTTGFDRIEGRGVICRKMGQCDTITLMYLDGGKYTGIYH